MSNTTNSSLAIQQCPQSGECASNWEKATLKSSKISGDENPIDRNKCISAAYADMALKDPSKYRWAGAAAFVSTNGGEAMKVAKSNTELSGVVAMMAKEDSSLMLETLGKINKSIFSDIYPALAYYDEFGLESLERCQFQNPDGIKVDKQLIYALRFIEQGEIEKGSLLFAKYEQGLVQNAYDDQKVTAVMKNLEGYFKSETWVGDQWNSIALGMAHSVGIKTMPPQIAMSADPTSAAAKEELVPMDGSLLKLEDRIDYYKKLEKIYSKRVADDAQKSSADSNSVQSQLELIRNECPAFEK